MNYIDKSEELLLNIENTYSKLESIIEIPGIKRKRKISHALPCEKAITLLITNLLKDKDYSIFSLDEQQEFSGISNKVDNDSVINKFFSYFID